jgi:hypothetical protein
METLETLEADLKAQVEGYLEQIKVKNCTCNLQLFTSYLFGCASSVFMCHRLLGIVCFTVCCLLSLSWEKKH